MGVNIGVDYALFILMIVSTVLQVRKWILDSIARNSKMKERELVHYRLSLLNYLVILEISNVNNIEKHHYLDIANLYEEYKKRGGNGEIEVRYKALMVRINNGS